MILDKMFL